MRSPDSKKCEQLALFQEQASANKRKKNTHRSKQPTDLLKYRDERREAELINQLRQDGYIK
jgi:hypothetical protein